MIDSRSKGVLQELLRRDSRSLIQYVSESFPWITGEERAALARFQQIVRAEQEGLAAIARVLTKHHVPPAPLGPYPMSFTTINYVSLEHLVPLLIEHQSRRITEIESELPSLADAEARQQVAGYLALKRQHLRTLEEMLPALAKKATLSGA